MNRRAFVTGLGAVLAAPLGAGAQQVGQVPRVGYISPGSSSESFRQRRFEAFRQGLNELGYVEGRNVVLEPRWAEGQYARYPVLAADLARLKVAAIVTVGGAATKAAKQVTSTIPIIMSVVIDPVGSGLITSLARPGGNFTGTSVMANDLITKQFELLKEAVPQRLSNGCPLESGQSKPRGRDESREGRGAVAGSGASTRGGAESPGDRPRLRCDDQGARLVESLARPGGNVTGFQTLVLGDFGGKQLDLLKTAVPSITRVAVLIVPTNPVHRPFFDDLGPSAAALKLKLQLVEARAADELERAFDAAAAERADAVYVFGDPITFLHRRFVAEVALRRRLPTMYLFKPNVEAGGLMSYGPSEPDMLRRAATSVDKILKGAKPSELPVEQPQVFELVINLKTAKALGLTIPPSLLLRADQVIDP